MTGLTQRPIGSLMPQAGLRRTRTPGVTYRSRSFLLLSASLLGLALPGRLSAQDVSFDARSSGTLGSRAISLYQGTNLTVNRLNPFRYRYQLTRETLTLTDGPDLARVPGIPSVRAPKASLVAFSSSTAPDIATKVDSIRLEANRIAEALGSHRDAVQEINDAGTRVNAFVDAADLTEPQKTIDRLEDSKNGPLQDIKTGLAAGVLSEGALVTLETQVAALQGQLGALGAEAEWNNFLANATNTAQVSELRSLLLELSTALKAAVAAYPDIRAVRQALNAHQTLFETVASAGPAAFQLKEKVECGWWNGKSVTYKLTATPRRAEDQDKATDVVTFECPRGWTVTVGLGLSGVTKRSFRFGSGLDTTIVAGENGTADTTVAIRSRIVQDSLSPSFLPAVLLHGRVFDWTTGGVNFGVHLSAGVAVDLSTGDRTSELEWIAGLSVSLGNDFFVTGAVHVASVSELALGFSVGSVVPEGLAEPPTRSVTQTGLSLMIAYRAF